MGVEMPTAKPQKKSAPQDAQDRYISKHPRLTPYQREIMTILMEEAAEVIQAASKILRFGAGDGYPGSDRTNTQELAKEIGEMVHMAMLVADAGIISTQEIDKGFEAKAAKLAKFLQEKKPG
jgi:NTP pyrophosphatase (non-canonical NTP hydrolase)